MIRLAAFDLDGTLMGADQSIRPQVRRAIALAQERGVIVTLATGRMFSAALPFARYLNITAPLICCQGGWVQAPAGERLYHIPLPASVAQAALALSTARGWHAILYADGCLFLEELRRPLAFYEGLMGADFTVGLSWDEALAAHTPDKVLFVAEPEDIPEMAAVLKAHFDGSAAVIQSHAMLIEVVPTGVDKGTALAWLARYLGIAREEALAAGDQENDLTMVRWAGVGVAMGDAPAAVRQAADWVAPPVTEDGAAVILERFVLAEDLA